MLSCSDYVAKQFPGIDNFILHPFDYNKKSTLRNLKNHDDLVIQIIGTISNRKNIEFGVNIVKSLNEKGMNVRLDLLGHEGDASKRVRRLIEKRNINAKLHGIVENPYEMNANNKVITLVCSKNEPFGLTIPESIQNSIPVLTTNSAGAINGLPVNFVYEENDLVDACLIIEGIYFLLLD